MARPANRRAVQVFTITHDCPGALWPESANTEKKKQIDYSRGVDLYYFGGARPPPPNVRNRMGTPDDASAPPKILEKKRKEGPHGVQRRAGKN